MNITTNGKQTQMPSSDLQKIFFNTLKNALAPHISMVDEIAEILNMGNDSVYRRIRGETPMAIDELKILCDHFHISLDQVLRLENDSVVFHAPGINNKQTTVLENFFGILSELKNFNSYRQNEMLYLCEEASLSGIYFIFQK